MSKVFTFAAIVVVTALTQAAFAMESRVVEIKKHNVANFWVMQRSDDVRANAMMIGASEAVVDQIESFDFAKDYVCEAKFRDMGSVARGSLVQVMVYSLTNCAGRAR